MYAIKVVCKEVKGQNGSPVVREDEVAYVVEGEWGVTTSWNLAFCRTLITYETQEQADRVAKKLIKAGLHPWYVKAKSYEIVQVEPVYETKIVGWKKTSSVAASEQP